MNFNHNKRFGLSLNYKKCLLYVCKFGKATVNTVFMRLYREKPFKCIIYRWFGVHF